MQRQLRPHPKTILLVKHGEKNMSIFRPHSGSHSRITRGKNTVGTRQPLFLLFKKGGGGGGGRGDLDSAPVASPPNGSEGKIPPNKTKCDVAPRLPHVAKQKKIIISKYSDRSYTEKKLFCSF